MPWINEHKRVWRGAMVVMLLVSTMGPWFFDLLWVPAEYTCSAPAIRLDGDYCGLPVSGIGLFRWAAPGLVYASKELVSGAMTFLDWCREFLFNLMLFLLVLPCIPTPLTM